MKKRSDRGHRRFPVSFVFRQLPDSLPVIDTTVDDVEECIEEAGHREHRSEVASGTSDDTLSLRPDVADAVDEERSDDAPDEQDGGDAGAVFDVRGDRMGGRNGGQFVYGGCGAAIGKKDGVSSDHVRH